MKQKTFILLLVLTLLMSLSINVFSEELPIIKNKEHLEELLKEYEKKNIIDVKNIRTSILTTTIRCKYNANSSITQ